MQRQSNWTFLPTHCGCVFVCAIETACNCEAHFACRVLLCAECIKIKQNTCGEILKAHAGFLYNYFLCECTTIDSAKLSTSDTICFILITFLQTGKQWFPIVTPYFLSLFPPDFRNLCERWVRRPHSQREAVIMEPASNRRLPWPPLCELHLILERRTHVQCSAAQIQVQEGEQWHSVIFPSI